MLQKWWSFLKFAALYTFVKRHLVKDSNLNFRFVRALGLFRKLPLERHSTNFPPQRRHVVFGCSPSSLSKRSMHFQVSVFRFSAWKFNEDRGQFYYHAFTPEQPDLNYRNPMVVEEMKVSQNSVGCSLWDWRRYNVSVLNLPYSCSQCAQWHSKKVRISRQCLSFHYSTDHYVLVFRP